MKITTFDGWSLSSLLYPPARKNSALNVITRNWEAIQGRLLEPRDLFFIWHPEDGEWAGHINLLSNDVPTVKNGRIQIGHEAHLVSNIFMISLGEL